MTSSANTERFTGLADIYAAHRPTYPTSILETLSERCSLVSENVAIDVGSGTGISTAALAGALPGWRIIAVEPNADMLTKARATLADRPNMEFVQAGAEALPGSDAGCGLVLAAQALHWFDESKFFTEVERTLCPGGIVAILYNNRQNAVSVVLQQIESYFESLDDSYSRNYRARDIPGALRELDAFCDVERVREVWLRPTSVDDLVNYFMSRSLIQPLVAHVGLGKLRQRIGDIASEHARAGVIDIPFATELDMARRR